MFRAVIIGFTERLQEELQGRLDAEAAHSMKTLQASSDPMGHLIDVLLTFSQTGRILTHKDRQVAWEAGPLPVANADPVLLRSVVMTCSAAP